MEEELVSSVWFWMLIATVMIAQSTWLFLDARKRDSIPWFWGIWGLIQFPMPLILYWLLVRKDLLRRRKAE